MDGNPGTPAARGDVRGGAAGSHPRAAGRRAGGAHCAAPGAAPGAALPDGRSRRDGPWTGGAQRRPQRARALPALMAVRLDVAGPFTGSVRRADPGRGSQPRTSGPSRGLCGGLYGRLWGRLRGRLGLGPCLRRGSIRDAKGRRSGRLVRMAGCVNRRRKMLLNLRLSFFGRKNLAQPSPARMLAWNPNQSFWPRTMVRTQRSYRAPARLCWRGEIPSAPPRPSSARCDTRPDLETIKQCRRS